MKLAIWSTTTPRPNSTHAEMFRRQLEEVELAERIGIDQIWFFEHHLNPTGPVPSPNLLIAAAARTTSRIRFASMVNILPFRHPLLVAEEAAMLDNLTEGRFDMGLGRGLRPPEFAAFGVDQQQSREMFVESFDIIRRVFSDEMFEHRGKLLDRAEGCATGTAALCSVRIRRSWSARRARRRCAGPRVTISHSRRSTRWLSRRETLRRCIATFRWRTDTRRRHGSI